MLKISLKNRFKSWYAKKFARWLMKGSGQIRIFKMWEEGDKRYHKNLVISRSSLWNLSQIKGLALNTVRTGQLQPIPGLDSMKAIVIFFEDEGTKAKDILLNHKLTILFDPENNLFSIGSPAAFYMKDAGRNPVHATYRSEVNFGSLAEVLLENVEAECVADQLDELEKRIPILLQEIFPNNQN